ncbi:MAG: hypothetical protein HOK97_04170 [Deltaproteobacteria bacterium]|nr:hypothetical protein [Deltaproteobacteria bacterium]MBT6488933.1 hypothetical protein [Deltaproteobacteria bacterium]
MEKLLSWLSSKYSPAPPWLVGIGILLLCACGLGAAEADGEPFEKQREILQSQVRWSLSAEGGWTLDEARIAAGLGQLDRELAPSGLFLEKQTEIWFQIPSTVNLSGSWLLHSEQPGVRDFVLHHRLLDGSWKTQVSGESIPWDKRTLRYGRNTLPLPVGVEVSLLKVSSNSRVAAELQILEPENLLIERRAHNLLLSFTFAWTLLITLGLLLTRVVLRVKYLLWLSLGSFCYAASLLTFEGIGAEFLWPNGSYSSVRLIYLLGCIATGAQWSFVCARVFKRGEPGGGGWVGAETIAFGLSLAVVALSPLDWAGFFWLGATLVGSVLMAGLIKAGDLDRGECGIINTSNLIMLISTCVLVLELVGVYRIGSGAYAALWGLIGLVPTIWLCGVGHSYHKLKIEHADARLASQGFENQLQEAFESRLQIFSSIAHHLNNPLNYILLGMTKAREEVSYIQRKVITLFEHADQTDEAQSILLQFEEAFERCEGVFDDASFGVQRAAHVVDEMRGLSCIDGETAELIPLLDILDSMKGRVVDDLGKKIVEPVTLRENLGQAGDFGVYGNPYLIIHAIKNIVNNGYLFARRSSQSVPELVIDVDTKCKEGFVRILISNNGPPISTEHEAHIFRMGFSSYGRRGTGLNVTQSILREGGAGVSLEDSGRSSGWVRFSVVLPLSADVERSPTSSSYRG